MHEHPHNSESTPPLIHPRTLGALALGHESIDQTKEDFGDEIAYLSSLSALQRKAVFLDPESIPPELLHEYEQDVASSVKNVDFITWVITKPSGEDGDENDAVRSRRLGSLLQQNARITADRNRDPKTTAEIMDARNDFAGRIRRAVSDKWLSEYAGSMAVERIGQMPLYVGDVFRTVVEHNDAHYNHDTKDIVLSPLLFKDAKQLREGRHVIRHEMVHGSFIGFPMYRVLNEGMTEHISEVLRTGQPEVTHPDIRSYGQASVKYGTERQVIHALHNLGKQVVPVQLAIDAFTIDRNMSVAPIMDYETAIDDAWGYKNVLNRFHMAVFAIEHDTEGLEGSEVQAFAVREALLKLRSDPDHLLNTLAIRGMSLTS